MQKVKNIFKVIALTIGGIITLLILVVILFINLSPQFGRGVSKEQKLAYEKSGNYENGKFKNEQTTVLSIDIRKLVKRMFENSPDRKPKRNIIVEKIDSLEIVNRDRNITQLTWFGHSAFLLEMDGKKILLDPMFGQTSAPHPWFGPKRYSTELPIEVEKLPSIDAVIFSHDHYDHLDYGSIQKLKAKVREFYVPLGVGNHLLEWGVPKERIHELNWWDKIMFNNIELVCTPARHFSGRGIFDRSTTLWCSWVINGANESLYFSGDSGYGPHFKEIGEKHGPFDISLMECGQYNEDWRAIHMMPEETVQASIDLKSKLFVPIHWGGFTLAFHDWTDPPERVTKKATELNVPISTPRIGEPIIVGRSDYPKERWWTKY